MGALIALEAAGVDVPGDISILGIDDISFAFLARPPLTTISVPREQLGRISFQALEKMSKLKRQRGAEYSLETQLVIRKSTAPARQREALDISLARKSISARSAKALRNS
jgi:DNA-binding LacI/PurR family transcriptional regulator